MDENNYNQPGWQAPPQGQTAYQPPVNYGYQPVSPEMLPPQYRPLSAWAYFGYSVLFSIPLVGFVCLIIFSFNDSNINRRSYARSYWIVFILVFVLSFVFGIIAGLTGIGAELLDSLNY